MSNLKFLLALSCAWQVAVGQVSTCGGGNAYYQSKCACGETKGDTSFNFNAPEAPAEKASAVRSAFDSYFAAFSAGNFSLAASHFTETWYSTFGTGKFGVGSDKSIEGVFADDWDNNLRPNNYNHTRTDSFRAYLWSAGAIAVYAEFTRINAAGAEMMSTNGWYLFVDTGDVGGWKIAATGGTHEGMETVSTVCKTFHEICCGQSNDTVVWTGQSLTEEEDQGIKDDFNAYMRAFVDEDYAAIATYYTDIIFLTVWRMVIGPNGTLNAVNTIDGLFRNFIRGPLNADNYSHSDFHDIQVVKWGECCASLWANYTRINTDGEAISTANTWYFYVKDGREPEDSGNVQRYKVMAFGGALDIFTDTTGPALDCESCSREREGEGGEGDGDGDSDGDGDGDGEGRGGGEGGPTTTIAPTTTADSTEDTASDRSCRTTVAPTWMYVLACFVLLKT